MSKILGIDLGTAITKFASIIDGSQKLLRIEKDPF